MTMKNIMKIGIVSVTALVTAAPAFAQSSEVVAVTDLNIRMGPGAQFDVVGMIPGGEAAIVEGCLDGQSWCRVSFDDTTGWSFSDYLVVDMNEQAVALTTRPEVIEINTVTYEDTEGTAENQAEGAAIGATLGALTAYAFGGPIGGIIAGGMLGTVAGAEAAEIDENTIVYVTENAVETVYLDGEVVVGAGVPSTVTTYEVPDTTYSYLSINGQLVILDAETNQIVRVVR